MADETKTLEELAKMKSETELAAEAAEKLSRYIQDGMGYAEAMAKSLSEAFGNLTDATSQADIQNQVLQLSAKNVKDIASKTKENLETSKQLTKETEKSTLNFFSLNGILGGANHLLAKMAVAQGKVTTETMKGANAFTAQQKEQGSVYEQAKTSGGGALDWLGDKFSELWSGVKKAGGAAVSYALKDNPLIASMVQEVTSLYTELSTLTTGYAKFTGQVIKGDAAVADFSGRLINLQRRNRGLGATIKDLTDTYTALTKESRTYGILMGTNSKRNIAVADGLTEVAFRFSKVGLSTENFGQALDILGKTYRRTDIIDQSKALGAQFVNIGRVTGQSADAISKNFSTAMEHLAAYSLPRAKEEFKKLSAISAVTGVEFGKVMKTASQFDDIEKTAEKVGELNAMLGGPYLNTLDMVNATEAERIEMLKDMMTQSGENFNQMDRFKQKAIAESIGMDVQDASRLFSGQQGEIDSIATSIDKNAASYTQLSQAAVKSATSITEQLAATKQSTFLVSEAFNQVNSITRKANVSLAKFGDKARHTIGGILVGTLQEANKELDTLIKNTDDMFAGKGKGGFMTQLGLLLGELASYGKTGMIMSRVGTEAEQQLGGKKPNPTGKGAYGSADIPAIMAGTAKEPAVVAQAEQQKEEMKQLSTLTSEQQETQKYLLENVIEPLAASVKDLVETIATAPTKVDLSIDGEVMATKVFKYFGLAP